MKTIEFQGIISLDKALVNQLKIYLEEKETQVCKSIAHVVYPMPQMGIPPALAHPIEEKMKIETAVEAFRKNVKQVVDAHSPSLATNEWEIAKTQINNALWEYAEVLEGCAIELFQRIQQIGFEHWQKELSHVVDQIAKILTARMDELETHIETLESLLWEFRWACETPDKKTSFFRKLLFFWRTILDRTLFSYIRNSKKFLKSRYLQFRQGFDDYFKLREKIETSLEKFFGYQAFGTLEDGAKIGFRFIYRHLRLWELNCRAKALPVREPVRVLRSAYTIEQVSTILNNYFTALTAALFETSRTFKSYGKVLYGDISIKKNLGDLIKGYRLEVHTLGGTVGSYREFFLRTHPNPYIRTRWGFTEWVVGPEPAQTRDLLNLSYEIEQLDRLFEALEAGLEKTPPADDSATLAKHYREIKLCVREMGQPLTARSVMKLRAEKFLDRLQALDELSSFNSDVVTCVGKAFSKALSADWQYHVLFEIPLFHKLYKIHQGILCPIDDQSHFNRLNHFKKLIKRIQGWVKNRDTHRHVNQIETDMSDVKGELQDFFAIFQRIANSRALSQEKQHAQTALIAAQLLEYRYHWGKFFHFLHDFGPEGKLVRNQFFFVDQYFEAIENKLAEIKAAMKKKAEL